MEANNINQDFYHYFERLQGLILQFHVSIYGSYEDNKPVLEVVPKHYDTESWSFKDTYRDEVRKLSDNCFAKVGLLTDKQIKDLCKKTKGYSDKYHKAHLLVNRYNEENGTRIAEFDRSFPLAPFLYELSELIDVPNFEKPYFEAWIDHRGIKSISSRSFCPLSYSLIFNYTHLLWHNIHKRLSTYLANDVESNKKPNIVSYKWLFSSDELTKAFEVLKHYFHPDTTCEMFEQVFSKKDTSKLTKIRWHNDNASELLFFILQMMDKGLIEKETRTSYKRLTACFSKFDENEFNKTSMKAIKPKLDVNLGQLKKDAIIDALDELL